MTRKILIIRFSSIGDIVLTTPVIRATKMQFNGGEVEVHYLTKLKYAQILDSNPYVDKLYTIERHVSEVVPLLKQQQYDYIIDLHNNLRSRQLRSALKRPALIFHKPNIRRFFYILLKHNFMPSNHAVDRFMAVIKPLGVHNDMRGLDYFYHPEDKVVLTELPLSHRDGFIALVIGGQHGGKLYPAEKLVELCRQLEYPVVLLGGPEDQARGEQIAIQVGSKAFNACGVYSLNQSASLLDEAICVISNDTGLMHIAAAFKKPVISLWGATVPQFGMYPYLPGEGSKILEARSRQRPYSKHGAKTLFRAPYTCWDDLEPEKIVHAVRNSLR